MELCSLEYDLTEFGKLFAEDMVGSIVAAVVLVAGEWIRHLIVAAVIGIVFSGGGHTTKGAFFVNVLQSGHHFGGTSTSGGRVTVEHRFRQLPPRRLLLMVAVHRVAAEWQCVAEACQRQVDTFGLVALVFGGGFVCWVHQRYSTLNRYSTNVPNSHELKQA